jgi:hypothetical protein
VLLAGKGIKCDRGGGERRGKSYAPYAAGGHAQHRNGRIGISAARPGHQAVEIGGGKNPIKRIRITVTIIADAAGTGEPIVSQLPPGRCRAPPSRAHATRLAFFAHRAGARTPWIRPSGSVCVNSLDNGRTGTLIARFVWFRIGLFIPPFRSNLRWLTI